MKRCAHCGVTSLTDDINDGLCGDCTTYQALVEKDNEIERLRAIIVKSHKNTGYRKFKPHPERCCWYDIYNRDTDKFEAVMNPWACDVCREEIVK